MSQNFQNIPQEEQLVDSRQKIVDNFLACLSNHAGTTFPTHSQVQIGMKCFRTDELKLYTLKALPASTSSNWQMEFDFNKTATNKEYVDAHMNNKADAHGMEDNGGLVDRAGHMVVMFTAPISISGNNVTVATTTTAAGIIMNPLSGQFAWFNGGTFALLNSYSALVVDWDGNGQVASPGLTPAIKVYSTPTARPHKGSIILLMCNGAGNLYAPYAAFNDLPMTEFKINGNKVWHAGNDGAGSGLDADTVDGKSPGTAAGNMLVLDASGLVPVANLPNVTSKVSQATASALGLVKVGAGITLAGDGTISVSIPAGFSWGDTYTFTASTQGAIATGGTWKLSSNQPGAGSLTTLTQVAGVPAGTYGLAEIIQHLVNRSHTHGTASHTIQCACNCATDN